MADAAPRVGVYMLDVGQGDCTFVLGPEADATFKPILFDCRDAYVATRFVKDHRIGHLSAVVTSHLDSDHIAGMLPFLRAFVGDGGRVDALHAHIDKNPNRDTRRGAYLFMAQAVRWHDERRIPLAPSFRDLAPRRLHDGGSWAVDLVLPEYAALIDMRLEGGEAPNRTSTVLRVSMDDHAILVGGDATLDAWERLEPDLLPANVFRIPHHGGNIDEGLGSWKVADLYRRIHPSVAVISVGTNNGFEHPRREMLPFAPAEGGDCRVLCTQLTPRCHDDPLLARDRALGNPAQVTYPYRHRVARGDGRRSRPRDEVPCAGSIVAWLSPEGVEIVPGPDDWHDGFVDLLDHPLCRPPLAV
ncbi:uncharacterized protein SOCE26_037120 [Sorangium cellulosum]|uniref:Metallo-beta-lactamase domain-containing protein n=1 Tax=Sorangium cellulosum TaxID=56 RepID=A0A2L0ESP7_SORCE|nr:hypothetical protein [Sorangium cellulosum]AUX42282.1 uncharacterized protein SOCE26_037120 [Sorangium cellulosum]